MQLCSLCSRVLAREDYPEVPFCGVHGTEFIESQFFDTMFIESGKKPGVTRELRAKWRAKFVKARKSHG